MLREEHVERLTRLSAAITRATLEIPRGEETPTDTLLERLSDVETVVQEWICRVLEERAKD